MEQPFPFIPAILFLYIPFHKNFIHDSAFVKKNNAPSKSKALVKKNKPKAIR